MSFSVRSNQARRQIEDEKFSGRGSQIAGIPHFVVPGTSATHFAFNRDRHQRLYTTINAAYADVVSERGDAIVLTSGAHTLNGTLTVAKAGVSIWGPEEWAGLKTQRPSASVTGTAASDCFIVTATDVSFRGVTCIPITAKIGISFSALASRLSVVNCHMDMGVAVASTSTKGIVATGAAVDAYIANNTFYSLGAQGPFIDVTGLLNYAVKENDCIVLTGATMAVGVLVGAAAQGLIEKNKFFGGTLTAAISGTGATVAAACRIFSNRFGVLCTVPVDNFSATNLTDMFDNWIATIGAGSGGTIVTLNT